MSDVLELRKNVVTYTQDKTEWKWKEFTLGAIIKSEVYGTLKVKIGTKTTDLKTAVGYYQYLQNAKDWKQAKQVKEIIWTALDQKSRERIKTYYDTPEVRIASINRENPDDEYIVAFYALNEENYYQGQCESIVPTNYKEFVKGRTNNGKSIFGWYEEEHIIGGNSEVTYSEFMETSPKYSWLPKAIAVAKQFGVTPKWQPCVHSGKRGLGLTAHDARELQTVANWYSGLSDLEQEELKIDLSDTIWIHHENGIDSIQISEREYRQNPDKWTDWKVSETRDFRCDLYEEEVEE
jgi:hypothetical protein